MSLVQGVQSLSHWLLLYDKLFFMLHWFVFIGIPLQCVVACPIQIFHNSCLGCPLYLLNDSDEEKEVKRDLLLACVLAGEYVFAIKSFN